MRALKPNMLGSGGARVGGKEAQANSLKSGDYRLTTVCLRLGEDWRRIDTGVEPEVQQIIGPLGAPLDSGQSGDSCCTLRTVLGFLGGARTDPSTDVSLARLYLSLLVITRLRFAGELQSPGLWRC